MVKSEWITRNVTYICAGNIYIYIYIHSLLSYVLIFIRGGLHLYKIKVTVVVAGHFLP